MKVIKIRDGEWHGYAVGRDIYGKTKSEVMDKMYRAEHEVCLDLGLRVRG